MEMRYASYRRCGCVQGWCIVGGEYGIPNKEAVEMVSMWVRDGCRIETLVGEDVSLRIEMYCQKHSKESEILEVIRKADKGNNSFDNLEWEVNKFKDVDKEKI